MKKQTFPAVDPKTLAAVREAADYVARLDPGTVKVAAEAARTLATASAGLGVIDMTKLVDIGAISKAAKTLESFRAIVAPQVDEILKGAFVGPSAEALTTIKIPAFAFSKTLDTPKFAEAFRPRFAESLQALDVMKAFGPGMATLGDLPRAPSNVFHARVSAATDQAVALAETDDIDDFVKTSSRFAEMAPAKRRALAIDLCLLIAAFIALGAWLSETGDPRDARFAGYAIACAATLVRVLWRLAGKLG